MIESMQYGIYFFFAALAALSIPFVFFFIPETKGIALEDMDKLFDRSLPAHRAHKFVLAKLRAESDALTHENRNLYKLDTNKSNEIQNIEHTVSSGNWCL
ncbi:hypothetical protein QCA50_020493 [Cerrena zonata]|uniref:Major facilitator superfamily (MFS) profile domain-containing protein n=1 Tax=Cerrena zonata TaxID=2478898 RepID=A0AAW0FEH4_9APHY